MAKRKKQIESKPTRYRGVLYESRLEAKWAVLFDNIPNIVHFTYQPETWKLPNGWDYTPDFAIRFCVLDKKPHTSYIEIKPTIPNEGYLKTLKQFAVHHEIPILLFCGSIYRNETISFMIATQQPNKFKLVEPLDVFYIWTPDDYINAYMRAEAYRFDL